jgi:hypothetical protein
MIFQKGQHRSQEPVFLRVMLMVRNARHFQRARQCAVLDAATEQPPS